MLCSPITHPIQLLGVLSEFSRETEPKEKMNIYNDLLNGYALW